MATFFDVSLLGGTKVVFTFLLVYIITWGLLTMIMPFGKKGPTGPYAIIALVAAFFSVLSDTVSFLIGYMTPWFLFLIIFTFFVLFIIRMFGLSEESTVALIKDPAVYSFLIAILIILVLFSLGAAFGQRSLEATQGGQTAPAPTSGGTGVLQPLEPGADLQGQNTATPQPGQPGATATGSWEVNVINTLLHPKILAILAVFLIGMIAVWLLTKPGL